MGKKKVNQKALEELFSELVAVLEKYDNKVSFEESLTCLQSLLVSAVCESAPTLDDAAAFLHDGVDLLIENYSENIEIPDDAHVTV